MIARLLRRMGGPGASAELARGAVAVFILRFAGMGMAFVLNLLLIRWTGKQAYDIYIYSINWMIGLSVFCLLGFDSAMLRLIGQYQSRREWGLLRGCQQVSIRLVGLTSLVIGFIAGGFVLFMGNAFEPPLRQGLLLALPLGLPLVSLFEVRRVSLRGFRRAIGSSLPALILRPGLILLGLAILLLAAPEYLTGPTAVAVHIASIMICLVITELLLRRARPAESIHAPSETRYRTWLKIAFPLMLTSGFGMINLRADILMLGAIRGVDVVGSYAAAVQISRFILFGIMAMNAMAAPLIASLYATDRRAELQRMVSFAALGVTAFTVPACLALTGFGDVILSWFDPSFTDAHLALGILIGGHAANALAGPTGLLLSMTGHERVVARFIGLAAGLNLLLNALLIPIWGDIGAATATAVATITSHTMLLIAVRRKLSISPTIFSWWHRLRTRPPKD